MARADCVGGAMQVQSCCLGRLAHFIIVLVSLVSPSFLMSDVSSSMQCFFFVVAECRFHWCSQPCPWLSLPFFLAESPMAKRWKEKEVPNTWRRPSLQGWIGCGGWPSLACAGSHALRRPSNRPAHRQALPTYK
ncbi:hypothetical protein BU26DRAFT_94527 [Trematosphaeria pertusa]|uniref:Uncharacterized protein n=1 Tax=Trematosphaeria pertusa TaxID=390896 RepID=A0A6A6I2D8_9PLEO|nr:uncharacterized protein BU26DRAFT_94527 [Trematosphaeria pertusa]KAF2244132.1 hypothetical protein BU26DRAFT_94527 [Trematosphaeria pertusa]